MERVVGFMGRVPGKAIEVRACCIYRFDEDRLTSESVYFDHATLLAQIGVR